MPKTNHPVSRRSSIYSNASSKSRFHDIINNKNGSDKTFGGIFFDEDYQSLKRQNTIRRKSYGNQSITGTKSINSIYSTNISPKKKLVNQFLDSVKNAEEPCQSESCLPIKCGNGAKRSDGCNIKFQKEIFCKLDPQEKSSNSSSLLKPKLFQSKLWPLKPTLTNFSTYEWDSNKNCYNQLQSDKVGYRSMDEPLFEDLYCDEHILSQLELFNNFYNDMLTNNPLLGAQEVERELENFDTQMNDIKEMRQQMLDLQRDIKDSLMRATEIWDIDNDSNVAISQINTEIEECTRAVRKLEERSKKCYDEVSKQKNTLKKMEKVLDMKNAYVERKRSACTYVRHINLIVDLLALIIIFTFATVVKRVFINFVI